MTNAELDEIPEQRDEDVHALAHRRVAATLRAEVRHALSRAAAVWCDCGVEAGESVAVALSSDAESLVACLGAAEAGAVAVLVDPTSSPNEIERLHARGGWRFILAESREEQPASIRDFVLTRAEWRRALEAAQPPSASPTTMAA